jgi:hypothetical protein
MEKMKKTTMLLTIFVLTMAIIPSAMAVSVPVHYVLHNSGKFSAALTPYMDLGTGHFGTWSIDGTVSGPLGSWSYHDKGHVLPVFSRYWGWTARYDCINRGSFRGNANI